YPDIYTLVFSVTSSIPPPDLPSFPTRRSSDLAVDLFQFSKQPLRFRELGENGIVCLGKSVRDPAGKLNQPFAVAGELVAFLDFLDRKSTRLNSSHGSISYAVFCLKKKKKIAYT